MPPHTAATLFAAFSPANTYDVVTGDQHSQHFHIGIDAKTGRFAYVGNSGGVNRVGSREITAKDFEDEFTEPADYNEKWGEDAREAHFSKKIEVEGVPGSRNHRPGAYKGVLQGSLFNEGEWKKSDLEDKSGVPKAQRPESAGKKMQDRVVGWGTRASAGFPGVVVPGDSPAASLARLVTYRARTNAAAAAVAEETKQQSEQEAAKQAAVAKKQAAERAERERAEQAAIARSKLQKNRRRAELEEKLKLPNQIVEGVNDGTPGVLPEDPDTWGDDAVERAMAQMPAEYKSMMEDPRMNPWGFGGAQEELARRHGGVQGSSGAGGGGSGGSTWQGPAGGIGVNDMGGLGTGLGDTAVGLSKLIGGTGGDMGLGGLMQMGPYAGSGAKKRGGGGGGRFPGPTPSDGALDPISGASMGDLQHLRTSKSMFLDVSAPHAPHGRRTSFGANMDFGTDVQDALATQEDPDAPATDPNAPVDCDDLGSINRDGYSDMIDYLPAGCPGAGTLEQDSGMGADTLQMSDDGAEIAAVNQQMKNNVVTQSHLQQQSGGDGNDGPTSSLEISRGTGSAATASSSAGRLSSGKQTSTSTSGKKTETGFTSFHETAGDDGTGASLGLEQPQDNDDDMGSGMAEMAGDDIDGGPDYDDDLEE